VGFGLLGHIVNGGPSPGDTLGFSVKGTLPPGRVFPRSFRGKFQAPFPFPRWAFSPPFFCFIARGYFPLTLGWILQPLCTRILASGLNRPFTLQLEFSLSLSTLSTFFGGLAAGKRLWVPPPFRDDQHSHRRTSPPPKLGLRVLCHPVSSLPHALRGSTCLFFLEQPFVCHSFFLSQPFRIPR